MIQEKDKLKEKLEKRFKRTITIEETYLHYTTYTKYFRKRFRSEKDLQNYIEHLKNKSYETSSDGWTVNYYMKVNSINKYIML